MLCSPEGKLTYSLEVTTGIRQGCRLCLTLFLLAWDIVMNKVIRSRKRGIQWRMIERLDDVDFADDLCLLAQRWSDIKAKLKKLENEATEVGLKINEFETKEMRVSPSTNLVLTINGREKEGVKSLTYAGSIVTVNDGALEDVHSHTKKAMGPSWSCTQFGGIK